jgi:hypothetical protein
MKVWMKISAAILAVVACLFFCVGEIFAQPNMSGKKVKGFTYPEYDAEGELLWQLRGDAQFETNDRAQMRNVRLETFEKGKLKFVFITPACLFDRATKNAESEEKIEVQSQHINIEGEGFVWTGEEGKMIVRRNVRVTFTNVRKQLEEFEQGRGETPPKEGKSP